MPIACQPNFFAAMSVVLEPANGSRMETGTIVPRDESNGSFRKAALRHWGDPDRRPWASRQISNRPASGLQVYPL